MSLLENFSIHAWIQEHQMKTEKGILIDFYYHLFLFEPYTDLSAKQVMLKAAQIGLSTLEILKIIYVVKVFGIDAIYTLPTDGDVSVFVNGKVNRIIANNPILQTYTHDRDNVEQKAIGKGMVYFRGTFTKRAAISVSSDLLIHDEEDFSDQVIIGDYESRLQHSKYKWHWHFGHPSTEGVGVSRYWEKSDQKHWFITCPHCKKEHYMSWPESIDKDKEIFICKYCKGELSDEDRRKGRWVAKYNMGDIIESKGKEKIKIEYSGYWIPLLIAPWIKASYIIELFKTKSEEYFWNRVLGLPYVGSGNKVSQDIIMRNLTEEQNFQKGRIVIGCDTGKYLRFVIGNELGIFHYGEEKDQKDSEGKILVSKYDKIEYFLNRWPNSIVVFDQGGEPEDSVRVRELKEKYIGRVFLAFYREDRKTQQLVTWGDDEEYGNVVIDRNRTIQLVIDEFSDSRIPLFGSEADFWDYWIHWSHIYRVEEETKLGTVKRRWMRSNRDDWVHATVYWRVGMSRFAHGDGKIYENKPHTIKTAPEVEFDQTVTFNPLKPEKKTLFDNTWKIL